jgi:predicted kinase
MNRRQRPAPAIWQPEAIVLIGLQGSGKSSFYQHRFFSSHLRINLDMLRTRHRERLLLRACIEMQQHFVVDNTNVTIAERARYLQAAQPAGFRVIGYFFQPDIRACIARNRQRTGRERVPDNAIFGTAKRLQAPTLGEGFDALYSVELNPQQQFTVTDWTDGVS